MACMHDVLKDVSEGVMTLTLNRVDKKNALTQAMYGFIADALLEAAAAPGVVPGAAPVAPR